MKMIYKGMAALLSVAAALAMTACGGPSGAGGPASSDTTTVGVANVPTTLDPGQNFQSAPYGILLLAAGTLTNVSPDGKQATMGLAASVEPGDQRFVVKLKPDLKFSDGSSLTAADVAASFEHYLADTTNGYSNTFEPIKKVTAADALTVNFDLKRPYPSLPMILALPTSAVLPASAIKARDPKHLYEGDPLPTAGQFQVKSFGNDEITLQANANYPGAQTSTKTLVFKQISDPSARMVQLQAGQIDFADKLSPKQLTQLPAGVTATQASAAIGAKMLLMNNRDSSVLSDVRIRKALSLAVNRNQINQVAYGGLGRPALGLFGSGSQWNENFLPADADVAAAKKLLDGTKCANGCTLKFIGDSTDQIESDSAIVVQANLKEIGVAVTIQNADSSTTKSGILSKGDFDVAIAGPYDAADYPDQFLGYTLGPVVKALRSGYSSSKMNQLIDEVNSASGPERAEAAHRVNALFQEDLPMAPLMDVTIMSATRIPAERFTENTGFYFHVG